MVVSQDVKSTSTSAVSNVADVKSNKSGRTAPLRSFEIERAAHALRARLSFAAQISASKPNAQGDAYSSFASSPSLSQSSSSSMSPPSPSPSAGVATPVTMFGLGLGVDALASTDGFPKLAKSPPSKRPALVEALSSRSNADDMRKGVRKTPSVAEQQPPIAMSPPPPPRAQLQPSPKLPSYSSSSSSSSSSSDRRSKMAASSRLSDEPNLYDSIFGPGSGLSVAQARKRSSASTNSSAADAMLPSTPTAMNDVQRSPHVHRGSSAQLHAMSSMPQLGSPGRSGKDARDPHNDPELSQRPGKDLRPTWEHHSVSFASPVGSPSRKMMQDSRMHQRRNSGAFNWPSSPARSRQRSAGGTLLPNGHPASSLAQDLGIARSAEELSSRPTTPSLGSGIKPQTPSWRSTRRSSIDGRHQPLNSNGHSINNSSSSSEAAAHSLLDLAASPSPSPSGPASCARFAGHTPSLLSFAEKPNRASVQYKLFDDVDDRKGEASQSLGNADGELEKGSLPSSQGSAASDDSEVSALSALQPAANLSSFNIKREELEDGDHNHGIRTPALLKSPPMTPPRTESKDRMITDLSSHFASSTPSSSTKRARNLVLVDEMDSQPTPRTRMQSREYQLSSAQAYLADETRPSTPPKQTPSSTPTTPKAPGSNFRYGDFLHVSPSPQPRSRTSSANVSARQLGLAGVQDTPTRGSKSIPKFLDFGSSSGGGGGFEDEEEDVGDDLFLFAAAAKRRSGSPLPRADAKRSRQTSFSMM